MFVLVLHGMGCDAAQRAGVRAISAAGLSVVAERAFESFWIASSEALPPRPALISATQLGSNSIEWLEGELVVRRGLPCGPSLFVARSAGSVLITDHFAVAEQWGEDHSIDVSWLAATAVDLRPPSGATPRLSVARLAGGETRTIGLGGERVSRVLPLISESNLRLEDAADAMWEQVCLSVARLTEGARKVAILLSGGLDSSGVLAAAVATNRGMSPKEVSIFSWNFRAGAHDDWPYVEAMAREVGIAPIGLSCASAAPSEGPHAWQKDAGLLAGLPYPMISGRLELFAAEAAREAGAEVLLTGAGGDEILAGPLQTMCLNARAAPIQSLQRAAALELPWPTTPAGRMLDYIMRPMIRPWLPQPLRARGWLARERRWADWMGRRARECQSETAVEEARLPRVPCSANERLERTVRHCGFDIYGDLRTQLEHTIPGVRRADPLLDAEFVQFVASLPPGYLRRGDRHRGLWRDVLHGRAPASIEHRKTKGELDDAFGASLPLSDALREFVAMPRHLIDLEIANPERWSHYSNAVLNASDDADRAQALGFIYAACTVEAWLRGNS